MAVEQFKQLVEAGVKPEDDTPEGAIMRRFLMTSHEAKLHGEEAGVIEDADQDEIPTPGPDEASEFKTGPEQDSVPSRVLTEAEKTGPEALPEPSLRLPVEKRTGPEAEPLPARVKDQPPVEQDMDPTTIATAREASTMHPDDTSALEEHVAEHGGTKPQKRDAKLHREDERAIEEAEAGDTTVETTTRREATESTETTQAPTESGQVEETGGKSARAKSGRRS